MTNTHDQESEETSIFLVAGGDSDEDQTESIVPETADIEGSTPEEVPIAEKLNGNHDMVSQQMEQTLSKSQKKRLKKKQKKKGGNTDPEIADVKTDEKDEENTSENVDTNSKDAVSVNQIDTSKNEVLVADDKNDIASYPDLIENPKDEGLEENDEVEKYTANGDATSKVVEEHEKKGFGNAQIVLNTEAQLNIIDGKEDRKDEFFTNDTTELKEHVSNEQVTEEERADKTELNGLVTDQFVIGDQTYKEEQPVDENEEESRNNQLFGLTVEKKPDDIVAPNIGGKLTLQTEENVSPMKHIIPVIINDNDEVDSNADSNVASHKASHKDANVVTGTITEQGEDYLDNNAVSLLVTIPEDKINHAINDGTIGAKYAENVEQVDEVDEFFNETTRTEIIANIPVYKYIEVPSKVAQMKELTTNFVFGLAVVDFNHLRGPELQYWLDDDVMSGNANVEDKLAKFSKVWPYFAFQALPDGVHKFDETFTQFTLCYNELMKSGVDLGIEKVHVLSNFDDDDNHNDNSTSNNADREDNDRDKDKDKDKLAKSNDETILLEDPNQGVVTLFGCACIRQLDAKLLKQETKRSVVQKSVIIITRAPMPVQMREKLSIVTKSWFEQYDFHDVEILKMLYENLTTTYNKHGFSIEDDELYEEHAKKRQSEKKIISESDFFMGLDFQDVVLKMKRNLLVVLKCLMLAEYRILIFSKELNELSNVQYTLVGLISNLIMNLEDSGYPPLDKHLHDVKEKTKSLKSSDRASMLKFLGLPLRIFGQGSFFQPYLTLQQLSYITNVNTRSFLVGSSNDVLLDHKKDWFDLIVYLNEKEGGLFSTFYGGCKIEILNPALKEILSLSWDDKKFADSIISAVEKPLLGNTSDSVDHDNKSKTINSNKSIENETFVGGDDFIRTKVEDYIIGFLSSLKYDNFINNKGGIQEDLSIYRNDIGKFNKNYVNAFKKSRVYREWNAISEDELFSFFLPGHVNSGEAIIKGAVLGREKAQYEESEKDKAVAKLKNFFSWKK